ncbi:hypothetical protein ZHAS_00013060 [Anopheles sinensis]|uniref:Uncharacterized protein n=1 Tax=Anopheles sinensis TaxID=74873 RepID=A0A084W4T1_ANOSI|nr:hypothetical protein ZHAS_00013060 [Anopheles sinensis]
MVLESKAIAAGKGFDRVKKARMEAIETLEVKEARREEVEELLLLQGHPVGVPSHRRYNVIKGKEKVSLVDRLNSGRRVVH